jgi:4-hydroxy-2-oxoheptanedioate aldolase
VNNRLLQTWRDGQPSYGVWSNLPDIHLAETLARTGADWICFDLQHGLMDYGHLTALLPAVTGVPITPLVRVALNQPDHIGKALDVGAKGVIVPMVNTAADAARAVASCYYPPKGLRSCGPMRDAMIQGLSYLAEANDEVACILMIETEEGLQNLEEIASVDGVTGLFVGPMDLTYGLGLSPGDFTAARFTEALATIKATCKTHDLACGIFGYDANMARQSLQAGFDFASVGSDISFVRAGVNQALATAKGLELENHAGGY